MAQKRTGVPSLAKMSQQAMLDEITATITEQARASTFACGGDVTVDKSATAGESKASQPVQVRYGADGTGRVLSIPAEDDDITALNDLISACSPASFGRGGEDVYDEAYRKAGKLDASNFMTSFCPYATGIIDIVGQLLLPNAVGGEPRAIKAELYKLNVYSAPSGLFKAHVDTPRSVNQFGSLVVALPVAHQGGALLVRSHGKEVKFDWSSALDETQTAIKWAAFYSDCEHEVSEVTSGHRITLTYNLYVTTPGPGLAAGKSVLDPTQLPLYEPLKSAIETPGFLGGGRVLGVWLSHNYAHTNKQTNFLPSSLKGSDMAVYEIVRALGLTCFVRPVLSFDYYRRGGEYSDDESEVDDVMELIGNTFYSFKCDDNMVDEDEKVEEVSRMFPSVQIDERKMTWLNHCPDFIEREPALAHITYGNEPGMEVYYSAAALIIHVPGFSRRNTKQDIAQSSLFDDIDADKRPQHDIRSIRS